MPTSPGPTPPHRRGPIGTKLLKAIRKFKGAKVINLEAVRAGREHSDALQQTVAKPEALRKLDPLHAYYVSTQNFLSVTTETLSQLPALDAFVRLIGPAEDEYLPSGPPMSPLTKSYFTAWATFDAWVGMEHETLATVVLDIASESGINDSLQEAIRLMQASRMGFYIQIGTDDRYVLFEELVTGKKHRCIVPAGHRGETGVLWLIRVMPSPRPWIAYDLVYTTPYIIYRPDVQHWLRYFALMQEQLKIADASAAYAHVMKWGVTKNHWNEYIFEAYANHREDFILLKGYPDVPESRPHR